MTTEISVNEIGEYIAQAIESKNEIYLKKYLIKAMEFFLNGELTKDELDIYGSYYLTIPIQENWPD